MRIAVIGATGVLGRNVVPRLIERGHTVRAGVRDPERARFLAVMGAELCRSDILDADSLLPLVSGCEVVLHLATAVPKPGQPMDWTRNDRIRGEGTGLLIAAARAAGVQRMVAQSVAMLHGGSGDAWVTEESPLPPADPRLETALSLEHQVRACGMAHCLLRGGLFYGPGSGREAAWREAARAGKLRLPGDGSDYVSLIHVADMARAVVAAVTAPPPATVLLVVDDEPVTLREVLTYVAREQGVPVPRPGGSRLLGSFRASNELLRHTLNWRPLYPTFRSGLAETVA